MSFLIGTDEAGYGPNLGPLVVAITVWQVPEADCDTDLYRRLAASVTDELAGRRKARGQPRVVLADSKSVYNSQRGLVDLERGVLALLAVSGSQPSCWAELWQRLAPELPADLDGSPWHAAYDAPLPWEAGLDEVQADATHLSEALARAEVKLCAVRTAVVFPQRFNQTVDTLGTKSALLTAATLGLLRETLAELPAGKAFVVCDKHGARDRYQALLQRHATDDLVEVYGESALESLYRWGPAERRVEVRFRPRAEAYLPAAAASMVAKYLRESALRAFNDFWQARVEGLRPTAGYPLDARRFRNDIAAVQAALGLDDTHLWRQR